MLVCKMAHGHSHRKLGCCGGVCRCSGVHRQLLHRCQRDVILAKVLRANLLCLALYWIYFSHHLEFVIKFLFSFFLFFPEELQLSVWVQKKLCVHRVGRKFGPSRTAAVVEYTHSLAGMFALTIFSALSISIPWLHGTAGLARQSPALPLLETSTRCLRR